MTEQTPKPDHRSAQTKALEEIAAKRGAWRRTHRVDNQGRVFEIHPTTGEDIGRVS